MRKPAEDDPGVVLSVDSFSSAFAKGVAVGSVNQKVDPWLTADSTPTVPPCDSMICLTSDNPNPVPLSLRRPGAVEGLEYARQVLRRDTAPAVRDFELHRVAARPR